MKRRHYGTSTKKSTAWPTGKDCFCTFTSMRVSLSSSTHHLLQRKWFVVWESMSIVWQTNNKSSLQAYPIGSQVVWRVPNEVVRARNEVLCVLKMTKRVDEYVFFVLFLDDGIRLVCPAEGAHVLPAVKFDRQGFWRAVLRFSCLSFIGFLVNNGIIERKRRRDQAIKHEFLQLG